MWDYIEFWVARKLAELLTFVIIIAIMLSIIFLVPLIGYYIRKFKSYLRTRK